MSILDGTKAVVTGGARGLGAAIVKGLAAAGAQVTSMDIRDEAGRLSAEGVGTNCRFIRCDVRQKDEVSAAIEKAVGWMGGLDVLCAVAGIDRPGYAAQDIPLEAWEEVMATNARGTFLTNQAAFHFMKERGGCMINFASHAGIRGHAERAAYSASKGAVLAWTRAAAQAWGRYNITVNAVAPQMRTEVAEKYLGKLPSADRERFLANLAQRVPLGGGLGEPEQHLVPLLLFLCGGGARFITGQTFAVDGGMTMLGS
jgi:NAD(P)-dependent dehydrogenase (short-subunit alcohol dehydrogenase family)